MVPEQSLSKFESTSSKMSTITGKTNLVGLLGQPVNHSLSPIMHNAAYKEMGLDWCYVAMPCDSQDLEKVTKALRFLDFKGLNITIPHKQEVLKACNKLTEIANDIQAVNTLIPEKNNQWINITSVDNRFDFSKNEKLISGDSYMSSIIMHKPSYLFSYTNIGYQSYLNSQEEIDLIEKLFFDCYRLGDVLDNIKITEPVFRESDIVTFDLKCLSAILTGNSKYSSPNGFDSRSICALSRYAGISDRVSVIGFFELFNFDLFHKLFAQIIWYFIEGFSCRFGEYPLYTGEGFKKFTVQLSDRDLIFHQSQKSKRWWVEIVIKSYPSLPDFLL